MKRREFMALLGGAAATWPLATRAQQPVVAFLRSTPQAGSMHLVTAFRQGLKEAGFVEGQNVAIDYRWADDQIDRLAVLAADLIRQPVAVIVGNNPAAVVAKAATATVPIVFVTGGDPVTGGLVTSFNRPGGNVTGVQFFAGALGTKRLELLRQLRPKAARIAMLVNPITPEAETERKEVQAAAQTIGTQLIVVDVNTDRDIEPAFATFVQRGADALLVGASPFWFSNRKRLVELAARHAIPAIYTQRETVMDGGLMSYASSIADAYRQVGIYVGRILKGEKPGDLPVMRSTKLEFVLNLKTAKALGLEIPPTLLALADEVIE